MTLTLHVDGERWSAHLHAVAGAMPGIVPVIKGNGYGFGNRALARRAGELGAGTVAVGTYTELVDVLPLFGGDVVVMTPWRPFAAASVRPERMYDPRVVHTVSRVEDVAALREVAPPGTRVLIEGETSMARHGVDRHALAAVAEDLGDLRLEGFSLHLPMTGDNLAEADRWAGVFETSRLRGLATGAPVLSVSHLRTAELAALAERRPQLSVRPRVGTALWLGDRGAFRVTGQVLDSHQVERGERVGYRQRPVPAHGTLLVVSGGTAHGIGLEAPTSASTLRQRATSVAKGGLGAAGFALSPFTVGDKQRWFVEPPHMQASMILVPSGVPVPAVGDEVEVDVRMTTTQFDAVDVR
ncbi:alanine racemase [Mumia flava]|uniref:Alanine racemase n=1 Tax=Mumia flava TaxID=1348852 RepID=A0A0B2B2J9_9ACTN|nr:alanine racemase [Mumia flava]PJJ57673.1 alanine racemase [Mumia flava]